MKSVRADRELNIFEIIDRLNKFEPIAGFLEHIVLGFSDIYAQSEHLARYTFAADYTKGIVLDIASGTGYGSNILGQDISNYVIAADIDDLVLIYGKRVYDQDNIEWVQCDARYLPFKDGSFDSVVVIETLEHIEEIDTSIQEFFRIMNSSSRLILSTPNKNITSPIIPNPLNPHHYKEYNLKELSKKLRRVNLKTAQILFQTRIRLPMLILRIYGILFAYILKRFGISIIPLRNFLKKSLHVHHNEQKDPDPNLYPIYAYDRIFDIFSYFQLLIIAEKER